MAADLSQQYRENTVAQADPLRLVSLMYEGATRFVRRAKKAALDGEVEGAHNNIQRAYAVVAELMATLDFKSGGEIAAGLERCYEYVLHLLKEADITKDPRHLDEVINMLEQFEQTWSEAFYTTAEQGSRTPLRAAAPRAPENGMGNGQAHFGGLNGEAGMLEPAAAKNLDIMG